MRLRAPSPPLLLICSGAILRPGEACGDNPKQTPAAALCQGRGMRGQLERVEATAADGQSSTAQQEAAAAAAAPAAAFQNKSKPKEGLSTPEGQKSCFPLRFSSSSSGKKKEGDTAKLLAGNSCSPLPVSPCCCVAHPPLRYSQTRWLALSPPTHLLSFCGCDASAWGLNWTSLRRS